MKQRKSRRIIIIGCLTLSSLWPVGILGQRKIRIDRRTIRPNLVSPDLYSDKLSLKITLMNLPGATTSASYWEVEYKVFFVPEQDFEKSMKELNRTGKGRDLRPEYFPSRILLTTGKFNKQKLDTLQERAYVRNGIAFRDKIPADQQTSFSSLMSFYSVRVFDGKLKKDIYGSDVFIVPPFEADTNDKNSLLPRTDLFLNFFVAEDGSLYRSNTRSASETTEWNPN
jgi:hypothetical protein